MTPLKMLGLAALVALMAMVSVGASSAMAEETVLCKTDESKCAEANLIKSLHETTEAGSPAQLLTSAGNITCDVLFASTSVGAAGKPQVIKGKFTYSNCKRNGTETCTVEEKNGPSEVNVLKESTEEGSVTFKGEVNFHCGSFVNCTYDGTGLKATAKGPLLSSKTNGSFELEEQTTNHISGLLCPATAKLDIVTTPLSTTYIGGEIKKGEIEVSAKNLLNVGETETIIIKNVGGEAITIEGEEWNTLYLEGLGANCLGKLSSGASCETRKLNCLKKGATLYTLYTAEKLYPFEMRCD